MNAVMEFRTLSVAAQIKSVEREIAIRREVYPHRVASGKMKQATADYEISAMRAVLQTLRAQA